MKTKSASLSAFLNLRASIALVAPFIGVFLALFASAMRPPGPVTQAWVARYNGPGNLDDRGHAIVGDSSGNVYVTGGSHGLGTDLDYGTIMYNSAGAQQWVARYNGPANGWDRAAAIARDGAGNVYVTGQSLGLGTDYDYATVKYDSAGQEQWVARYNGPGNGEDDANAIAVDSSGNLYVTGQSTGLGTGFDYATIKYDSAGQEQWVARLPLSDMPSAIAVDSSGNVYVTGRGWCCPGTLPDYATVKYDSAGQQQWVAYYNGPGNGQDEAYAIAVDSSGNVHVTGRSPAANLAPDYATIKYDSAGQEQWVVRYNGPGDWVDQASAIGVDSSGNVYVTGLSDGLSSLHDYATIKYNSAGQQQWVARYNGTGNFNDAALAIAVDSSGNVYVTGSSDGTRSSDYATVKYDSAGEEQWVARYNGPTRSYDAAQGIVVDGSDNVYVTGESISRRTGFDYATVKYVQNPP